MPDPKEESFAEYRRLILAELERHDRQYLKLDDTVGELKQMMSSVRTTLENAQAVVTAQAVRVETIEGELGKRVQRLEDDFNAIKIKIALIAGGAGAAGVGGFEIIQSLLF